MRSSAPVPAAAHSSWLVTSGLVVSEYGTSRGAVVASGQAQVQCTVARCACPLQHYVPRPSAHIRALRAPLTINGVEIEATAKRMESIEQAAVRARATTPPPHPDDLWLEWMTTFNKEVEREINRTRVAVPDTQKARYVNAIMVGFYLLVIALFLLAVSVG